MPPRARIPPLVVEDDGRRRPLRTQRVLFGVLDPNDDDEVERAMRAPTFCYRGFWRERFEQAAASQHPELAPVFAEFGAAQTALPLLRADIRWADDVLRQARLWADDGAYRALAAAVLRAARGAEARRHDELRRAQLAASGVDLPGWVRRRELGGERRPR
jgi:hypothetical protein